MFHDYYLSVLTKQYFQFDGRASRREFWMFLLYNAIIVIGLLIVDYLLSGSLDNLIVTKIYRLAVVIPMTAIAVRRLHDTGHSGYALFWGLIPILGAIYLIYLYCIEGQSWANEYGDSITFASSPSERSAPKSGSTPHSSSSLRISKNLLPKDK